MYSLTLLGMGSGDPRAVTEEARAHLETVQHVVVATVAHPIVRLLPPHITVESFDELYDRTEDLGTLPLQIATVLIKRASAGEPITFVVPGHPLVGHMPAALLRQLARERGVPLNIIGGLSLVEPVCETLDAEYTTDGLQIIDAFAVLNDPPFPTAVDPDQRAWSELQGVGPYTPPLLPFPLQPTQPALLQHPDQRLIHVLQQRLGQRYPADHPIAVVRNVVDRDRLEMHRFTLGQIDAQSLPESMLAWYIAPLPVHEDVRDIQSLNWVTARLLGPVGCPWDREQTLASLRRYLLEEAHEVLEALDAEDWDALSEELGDLLLQIVLHSEMARQSGNFAFGDVTSYITEKLIRRHPHVFGEIAVSGSGDVLRNWEAIKAQERASKGKQHKSLLDGVPPSLPALGAAQLIGEKAAKVGFDWPNIDGVWDKVHEELEEIRRAPSQERSEEFGDLLFVLARLASWLGVDAEAALRSANTKFRRRFAMCERLAGDRGLASMSPEELDALWNRAKRAEKDA